MLIFSGDISNPKKDKYNLAYYTKLADELIVNGAHVLCIKVGEWRGGIYSTVCV
jgi:pyruvate carboxylase